VLDNEAEWEAHRNAGRDAFRGNRPAQAVAQYSAALAVAERSGTGGERLQTSLAELAGAYERDYRWAEVAEVSRRLLRLQERRYGPDVRELVPTLQRLARATQELNRDRSSERLLHRALAIQERAFGHEHPSVTAGLHALGLHYLRRRRFADAEAAWLRAERIRTASPNAREGIGHDAILQCLVLVYREWRRPVEFEGVARRRLQIADLEGADHLRLGSGYANLAEALALQKRYWDAAAAYRVAIDHYQRWFRNTTRAARFQVPDTIGTRDRLRSSGRLQASWLQQQLARCLHKAGRASEAMRVERRVETVLERALAEHDEGERLDDIADVSLLESLADIYIRRGRPADAEPLLRRSLAVQHELAADLESRFSHVQHARARARIRATLRANTARLRRRYTAVLRRLGREPYTP